MPLRLITPPASEPVTLDDVKQQCRVDHDEQDLLLQSLIPVARQHIEQITGRLLVSATLELLLDRFPRCRDPIRIPIGPVTEIVAISYIDDADIAQTWAAAEYIVDRDTTPARIALHQDYSYPITDARLNAVTVRFIAGYQDANSPPDAELPEPLRQAMLLKAQELYDGKLLTNTIDSLIGPYKLWGF